jgi:hypothetical protein
VKLLKAAMLAPVLAIGGLSIVGLSTGAWAEATSVSLRLHGVVPAVCSVQVADAAASLNLTAGETDRQVGTVVENCNSGSGYQVTLSSASRGQLTGAGGAGVAYSVSYGDTTGVALAQPVAVTRTGAAFGRAQALTVSVPASPRAAAGDYEDLLTITIAAK